jgi:hypothetical protein
VESVTAFSTRLVPDKLFGLPTERCAPDFSVGCIRFRSGLVARLTCGIFAPHDHSIQIVGDEGVLSVDECWHQAAPVRVQRSSLLTLRAQSFPWISRFKPAAALFGLFGRRHPRSPKAGWRIGLRRHEMDYLLGVSELAFAVREKRACLLSAQFCLHVTEIALAMHNAGPVGGHTLIRSTLPEVELQP